MHRSLLCFFVMSMSLTGFAQIDSLTISDTIGVYRQRGVFQTGYGYRYYGATQLAATQLGSVLKRSPDASARQLSGQSQRLNGLATALNVAGVGFFVANLTTARRSARPNRALSLAGYGSLFGSFIPQGISSRQLMRSIESHNQYLRNRAVNNPPPVVYASSRQWTLSLADTIARKRVGLVHEYRYRGIRVLPGSQLSLLTTSLNDRDVNEGLRYVRTVSRIGSVIGGVGQGLVTSYVATLLLTRRYRRNAAIGNELLTSGLLCLGANFVLSRHANRIQRRWISQYNDRLRQQFSLR